MFVEGAGNEEQPTNTYPEIAKRTVLRRNGLSVFHLFPCHRLNISFESCCQKSFKTVDPSERSEETSPDISYKIISRGHQANFPFQNSSPSTQTSSPHTPILPIFTQYPEELGGRGKNKAPCVHGRAATALGRALEDETEIPRADAGEGMCSGQLCRALSHAPAIPARFQSRVRPGSDESMSVLKNQAGAGNSGWGKDDRPEQPPALPCCCLHFPTH